MRRRGPDSLTENVSKTEYKKRSGSRLPRRFRISEDEYIRTLPSEDIQASRLQQEGNNVTFEDQNETKAVPGDKDFWVGFFKDKRVTLTDHLINPEELQDIQNNKTKGKGTKAKTEVDLNDLERKDWETWWIRSPLWRRLTGLMIFLAFILIFVQMIGCFYFFITSKRPIIQMDPYLCRTKNCKYVSGWLQGSLNKKVSPCDNFYEFVCGNHQNENDDGELDSSGKHWRGRLEFGRNNVLAEVLKNFKRDKIHDQPIRFYQACLDVRSRNHVGLDVFLGITNDLFGDLSDLENPSNPLTLEEMAAKVIEYVGDFGFFDFEFNGHPFVLMDELLWINGLKAETIPEILGQHKLFGDFVKKGIIKEISDGLFGIKENLRILTERSRTVKEEKDMCDSSRNDQPLDTQKVMDLYAGDNVTVTFIEDQHKRFYYGITHCWDMALMPTKFTKSTFAAFWLLRILIHSLDDVNFKTFKDLEPVLGIFPKYYKQRFLRQRSLEFQCFKSMTRNLGYLPSHRYFEHFHLDPAKFSREMEAFFRQSVDTLSRYWINKTMFPHIPSSVRKEGMKLVTNTDPYYFMSNFPTVYDSAIANITDLALGGNHLQNAFNGKRFTLKQAKRWWKRVNDVHHVLMWNKHTFNIEKGYFTVSPTEKMNAILTPVANYLEPYESDMLAVRSAGATVVCIKEMLIMLYDYVWEENAKRKDPDWKYTPDGSNKSCMVYLYNSTLNYATTRRTNFRRIFENQFELFYDVMSLKVAYYDRTDREIINKIPFWKLNEKQKLWVMSKKLVGFEDYSEAQIFFMVAIRHYCKKKPPDYSVIHEKYVSSVLAVLMQMSEFADAWNCAPASPMNPFEKCF